MKKILINSKHDEETRIATMNNGKLIDLDIENFDRQQKKANIYKGYISRIEPSLNAVFISYGEEKNGFLPFKEISDYYFKDTPNKEKDNIASLLTEGQEILVQITKEERGDKGAALTTFISLAGSYMVLLPNNPNGGGISRKVEGKDRETLKKYLDELNIPKNMSVIARTACVECSFSELKHDFNSLVDVWKSIKQVYNQSNKPVLVHKESDIIVRTVRDHLKDDVEQIIVDSKDCFEDVKRQLNMLRQNFDINKVSLYKSNIPLFTSFNIDQQIENAYKREIRLSSGGSIVIDTTEALVAIDVNSGRANKADDVETTALKTNLEAAEEVARQLKIRDLGGLVIIDFIDMLNYQNRKQVEEKLANALMYDKARIQMSKISKLGLVEISRQRLNSSINESVMQRCPRCDGHGYIKTTQATALTILRKIRFEAIKEDTTEIRVQVPVDIAAYMLNEKRDAIVEIEKISQAKVMLIPNFNLESPKYHMQRIWGTSYKSSKTSQDLMEDVYNVEIPNSPKPKKVQVQSPKIIESKPKKEEKVTADIPMQEITEENKQEINFLTKLKNIFSCFMNETKTTAKNIEANVVKKKQEYKAKTQNKPKKQTNNNQNNNKSKNVNPNSNKKEVSDNKPNYQNKSQNNIKKNNVRRERDSKDFKSPKKVIRSNVSVNNSEEIVSINDLKYQKQIKETSENKMVKSISTNPQEFISPMVQDVLDNYDNLNSNVESTNVSTKEKTKQVKYLKFETATIDDIENKVAQEEKAKQEIIEKAKAEKKLQEEKAKQETIEKAKAEKKLQEEKAKQEATKKEDLENKTQESKSSKVEEKQEKAKSTYIQQPEGYLPYSPAIGYDTQSFVAIKITK